MIKTKVKNEKEIDAVDFPCLLKGKITGTIVLGIEPNESRTGFKGVKIFCPLTNNSPEFSRIWSNDCFEPFNGSITLENEK